jgi:hypothetical protein
MDVKGYQSYVPYCTSLVAERYSHYLTCKVRAPVSNKHTMYQLIDTTSRPRYVSLSPIDAVVVSCSDHLVSSLKLA